MSIVSQSRPCENVKRFDEQVSGRVDNCLQVTIAQASVLANERNHADIQRRRIDASLLLIKAVGGGWNVSELPKESSLR
jgi:outer membrane protein TolC